MNKEIQEHKERLKILEKHLDSFYAVGEMHNAISDAMKEYAELKLLGIAHVSGSISIEDTVNAFLDWMKSDDCWINDKDGNRIPDAEIDGKNFMKYAEKYYR